MRPMTHVIFLAALLAACTPAPAATPPRIVFMSIRDGNWEIYLMSADGSGQTNLTNDPGQDMAPACSGDGRRIAFVSDRDGSMEIYVMNADGTGVTRLTDHAEGNLAPKWCP